MSQFKYPLIAFTGFAGAGKDEGASPLIAAGFTRVAFGDIIKRELDPVVQKYFGFSAFTEVRAQKAQIRRSLESWGEDRYDAIFEEFFNTLPAVAVNPRLCRLREAKEWRSRGGILVEITRPDVGPETEWSAKINQDLRDEGLIEFSIANDGNLQEFHSKIRRRFLD